MTTPCICGDQPETFRSERTGDCVVVCRNTDCDVKSVTDSDPATAVRMWVDLVTSSRRSNKR